MLSLLPDYCHLRCRFFLAAIAIHLHRYSRLVCLGICLNFCTHTLQAQLSEEWARRYNNVSTGLYDVATAMTVDGQGNVYVTGYSYKDSSAAASYDYLTIKYNAQGNMLWQQRHNGVNIYGTIPSEDYPQDIAADSQGNVYVTGASKFKNKYDFPYSRVVTVKYSPEGKLLWAKEYRDANIAKALYIGSQGTIYITGVKDTETEGILEHYFTLTYDPSGNLLGSRTYNPGHHNMVLNGAAIDAEGNSYFVGHNNKQPNTDYVVAKYTFNGLLAWRRIYSYNTESKDVATAIVLDGQGNTYVTGNSTEIGAPQSADFVTLKFDSQGNRLWVKRYNSAPNSLDQATALTLDKNGRIRVAGKSGSTYPILTYDAAGNRTGIGYAAEATALLFDAQDNLYLTGGGFNTAKYSATLNSLWIQDYNTPLNGMDYATAMVTDEQGNIYVTGYSTVRNEAYAGNNIHDIATIKYNARGQQVWVKRYNGPANGNDIPVAMAVDKEGNIIVAGNSYGGNSFLALPGYQYYEYDFTTIKYSPDGTELWVKRYATPKTAQTDLNAPNDQVKDLAVDEQGNIYVMGRTDKENHDTFYATLKYDAQGNQAWQKIHNKPMSAITTDAKGNWYATWASSLEFSWSDGMQVFKYNTHGNEIWQRTFYGQNSTDMAAEIRTDKQGNVYVTGTSVFIDYYADFTSYIATCKFDSTGKQLWDRYWVYGGSYPYPEQIVTGMETDNEGNVIVVGSIRVGTYPNPDSEDYVTLKYDSKGKLLWRKTYNGANAPSDTKDDIPTHLAVDKQGSVYVTGNSGTLKYDQAGNLIWTIKSPESNAGIAVTAQNEVIVAGTSNSTATFADFLTVKYKQPSQPSACNSSGSILREVWTNIEGQAVSAIPLHIPPALTGQLTSFEAPTNFTKNYGQRIRGYLCAPLSGTYTFYIAGDDNCELWLSSDENPANKKRIAHISGIDTAGFSGVRQWNKLPTQKSVSISLQAGKSYYIEVLHKEGFYADHLAAGWVLPNATAIEVIPGSVLSPFLPGITGGISREKWDNIPGASVSDIPLHVVPNSVGIVTGFETPSNIGTSYGQRLRGYVHPQLSGNYRFYIAADDKAELYLSTSDNPANKTRIAFIGYSSAVKQWDRSPSQQSAIVSLEAGKKYYVEALHKESLYADHLAVGWTTPQSSLIEVVPGSVLSPYITPGSGTVTREKWDNVPGSLITDIPLSAAPASVIVLTSFETPPNAGTNYGQRIRGYVHPQTDGNYIFYIAGDDRAELWLSTDEDPAKKTRIAAVPYATGSRQWNKYPLQKSAVISLLAGRKYYIEALHKEGLYADHLAVGWMVPNGEGTEVIPGSRLSPFVAPSSASIARMGVEESLLNQIKLYPNPFESKLTLGSPQAGKLYIRITDNLGRTVHQSTAQAGSELDLAHLKAGIYVVKVSTGDGTTRVVRVVKQ